jgi:hypothetical protein
MAFANPSYDAIMATTIESRSKTIADNVTNNNLLLKKLSMRGNIKPFSGGSLILQELSFAENSNAGFYSGYDILPVGVSDVISAAQYNIKQAAVPVVISGLEMLQNSGKERMIDLLDARMSVAESTMSNLISAGLYSDGTGYGGKEINGLADAVRLDPNTSDPYGGINAEDSAFPFWQNQVSDNTLAAVTPDTIGGLWNVLWANTTRGTDRVDLIICDGVTWGVYVDSLQSLQRFTSPDTGGLGFPTLKYMDADVALDGGIGGNAPAGTAYFLNTDYIMYRPHSQRNMVPLSPNKRTSINQDAEVSILGWAGNLTTSGRQFQGIFDMNGV